MRSALLITDFLIVEEKSMILKTVGLLISINTDLRNYRWEDSEYKAEILF